MTLLTAAAFKAGPNLADDAYIATSNSSIEVGMGDVGKGPSPSFFNLLTLYKGNASGFGSEGDAHGLDIGRRGGGSPE